MTASKEQEGLGRSSFGRWAEVSQAERAKQHQQLKAKKCKTKQKKKRTKKGGARHGPARQTSAPRFWFLGKVHSCMNHACGGAQNAALRFEARPGRVAVAVVAARDVRRGLEGAGQPFGQARIFRHVHAHAALA